MTNIIVAFSKPEDAKNIRNILVRNGFPVVSVVASGAQALSSADELGKGVLVCGYRFADMMARELFECLPAGFDMLLVASPVHWSAWAPRDMVCLGLPLKVHDLVSTLEMMIRNQAKRRKKQKSQPRVRSSEEQEIIARAKALLMDRNHMEEAEAHRYIQKCSMDNGTNMVETARMIISLIHF